MSNEKKKPAKIAFINDPKAMALINARAKRENRSASNAATTTILEALDRPGKDTAKTKDSQQ